MSKQRYLDLKFTAATLEKIKKANEIIAEYQAQGFRLTLRQLYYQFVARGYVPNKDREYKNLGDAVSNGRLAGLIDWDAIEDRTRFVREKSHWSTPGEIMRSAAWSFAVDRWATQKYRPIVLIEKDALVGVIEGVCTELDIPYLACRGYASQSVLRAQALEFRRQISAGQTPFLLHLGDHDPSGIDMTRDIVDRMEMFMGGVQWKRLALNMDQVEQYDPPPNPAKLTDSRVDGYIARYGTESWELDALDPPVIAALIRHAVEPLIDDVAWESVVKEENRGKELLERASERWDAVSAYLERL